MTYCAQKKGEEYAKNVMEELNAINWQYTVSSFDKKGASGGTPQTVMSSLPLPDFESI